MSGSRLGRGRGGRLAVYGACGVVVVLLVFLYRAATTEMSRLRELHVQCAHQQEALAAQLQVIFEYKVRLEKTLAEEKSSNAVAKQELQQRATREKSLRDKDSVEAMQRYNSLLQSQKLLLTENKDLQEECGKQQKQALEDTKRLEATLADLRSQIRDAAEDKRKTLENLKTVNLQLNSDKTDLENKYNDLLKSNGDTGSQMQHLQKQVFQLERELKEAQNSCRATSPGPSMISQRSPQQLAQPNVGHAPIQAASADEQQGNRRSPQQQILSSDATSSRKFIPAARAESSTKSGVNSASTVSSKSDKIVAAAKPVVKVKLPEGVLPILNIIDSNAEANAELEDTRKDDSAKNAAVKAANEDSKDQAKSWNQAGKDQAGNGIAHAPGQPGRRHMGEQILHRQEDAEWLREKGVQEIGELPEFGNIGKPDFEEGQARQGDVDYDNLDYYNKGAQAKHNGEESEDEGEEEEGIDYPNNDLKKQE